MLDGERRCPVCQRPAASVRATPSLPIGTVLALVGGLALLAAFWMPWLGVQVGGQGALLSGNVLWRLLAGASDLRQLVPGSSGHPLEAQALRALIALFPVSGAFAAGLALVSGGVGRRRWLSALLIVAGVAPLAGLLVGLTRLPPNASREIGLWLIGAGSVAVALGPAVNALLNRSGRPAGGERA